jgi:hypothetical protein
MTRKTCIDTLITPHIRISAVTLGCYSKRAKPWALRGQ